MKNQQANLNHVNEPPSCIGLPIERYCDRPSIELLREFQVELAWWLGVAAVASFGLLFWALAFVEFDSSTQSCAKTKIESKFSNCNETVARGAAGFLAVTNAGSIFSSRRGLNKISIEPPKVGANENRLLINEDIPDRISFNLHVRSILSENCFYCHGPDANHRAADLRLDTPDGAFEHAIEPGDPENSEMIARILSDDLDVVMPPPNSGRVLSERDKRILEKWVLQGAKYERHWSFTKPVRPKLPIVKRKDWGRNAIDRFVLAKLEANHVEPAPRAEPHVIIRRLYLDLVGFPPKPDETRAFETAYQNDAEGSIEALVDQLLASPHYGERMALPWLDAARYSDSNGFQEDGDRTQYPWRDWVVNAMNKNMPFDQFTVEQIAGDLLPKPTDDQWIATAFHRNHMLNGEGGAIAEEQRNNYVFDRVDTTATTWLGLTLACAQCHDHKYDPISQKDYYAFFAFFNNVDESGSINRRAGRLQVAKPFFELATEDQKSEVAKLKKKIAAIGKKIEDANDEIAEDLARWETANTDYSKLDIPRNYFLILQKKLNERSAGEVKSWRNFFLLNLTKGKWNELAHEKKKFESLLRQVQAEIITVMVMRERKNPRKTRLLERGDYENPRQEVQADVPSALPGTPKGAPRNRLTLARWLVNPDNPLPSRVAVNRYWQTFFGSGLVKTSEDFGTQGELPSHPKLLDWLAVDFVENSWDVKRIHRMIVTSETYLQSSRFRDDLKGVDPENRLLARGARFRLPSMLIRDAALRVSGLLKTKVGGRPVYPYQPDGLWWEFSLERFRYKLSLGDDLHRRSLYTFWRRSVGPPNLFDAANRQTCSVKLSRTNTPLHALILMNDPTYVEAFANLAKSILTDASQIEDDERLAKMFVTALGRMPSDRERQALRDALATSRQHFRANHNEAVNLISSGKLDLPEDVVEQVELAAFTSVAQVVMNTDEFLTRE